MRSLAGAPAARVAPTRVLAVLAVGLAAILAGCGDAPSTDEPTTTVPVTTAATVPGTTDAPPVTSETDPATTTTRVPPDGEPAPDFTIALGEGGEFTLSEAGAPVYLVFWAEWCPVCQRELPAIDAVAPDYLEEVTFVAVAGRSSLEASRERVGDWFSPDRILWGYDDDLWATYLVRGQPVSFVISSDGIIVGQWFGSIGEAALRERLDALVAIG
jgi:thiol-disulfide isomerase/thioredoxin